MTIRVNQIIQSVTRPANTTAYAAGDVIDLAAGAGLTFASVVRRNLGAGRITDALLIDSAHVATTLEVELWLFNAALAVYDNDNGVFTPTDADLANLVGIVDFVTAFVGDATAGIGGNVALVAAHTFLPIAFSTSASAKDLFGVLVARNAYVPVSAEQFTVILKIEQGG